MYGLLLAVLILDGIFLTVVILLQSGKGGGLAAMGGSGTSMTDGVLAGRQATTVLTRATWIAGTAFMVLALVLAILSSRAATPESIIRPNVQQSAPQPVLPSTGTDGAGAILPGAAGAGDDAGNEANGAGDGNDG
ncbi:MAG: preprotein translocase subunit SecG [Longimicrobiales bacterium]|nr:preprotein translocase subunit SecG [Longimicrobiales bacterium]